MKERGARKTSYRKGKRSENNSLVMQSLRWNLASGKCIRDFKGISSVL